MTSLAFDIAIIGAGMAGASAAYELAGEKSVVLLEMEEHPGYHTTGRSAAFYSEIYGGPVIRALSTASRGFFEAPPRGFAEVELLAPSGSLFIAREDQLASLDAMYEELSPSGKIERREAAFALEKVDILNPDRVAACLWEPGAREIEVHELHQGFLRGAKEKGARLLCNAPVRALSRSAGEWRIAAGDAEITAPIVINAAGAWGDRIAEMAGCAPVGLAPMRRSACIIPPPEGEGMVKFPLVIDVDEEFYFKSDAGNILLSLAEETPSEPCDAFAEDMDIAIAVDRFETATRMQVRRVLRTWAGLRTFSKDRSFVMGFDPEAEGFFWLVGQGGYGIQTAPAAGRCAAALALGKSLPADVAALGVREAALSPARFR